ncbi:MAG: hypothetical protein FWC94_06975 [Bacteroidales bacterium]|nr:hypothetical protein [Bacteroidales bacterium]
MYKKIFLLATVVTIVFVSSLIVIERFDLPDVWTGVAMFLSFTALYVSTSIIKRRSETKALSTKELKKTSITSFVLLMFILLLIFIFRDRISGNLPLIITVCSVLFLTGCGFLYLVMKNLKQIKGHEA